MDVRVYVSGISGNKEVKKRQQRVTMILDSKNIKYLVIDIAEPGKENEKEFMQENSKARDSKYPLPPQIFNGDVYCGGYEEFDMANELDELEKFLKISSNENSSVIENGITNGSKSEIIKEDTLKEDALKEDALKEDALKEDARESAEEIVSKVNHNDVEAVSLGNDHVQNVSEEIPQSPEDISNDPDDITNDPDDVFKDPDDISKDPDPISGDLTEIPKISDSSLNDGDESESLNEDKNSEVEVENSSADDSDSATEE